MQISFSTSYIFVLHIGFSFYIKKYTYRNNRYKHVQYFRAIYDLYTSTCSDFLSRKKKFNMQIKDENNDV